MADEPLANHIDFTADPPSFTWKDFVHAAYEACKKAWDDGVAEKGVGDTITITLPAGVFPEVASIRNPIVGTPIPITRAPMFAATPMFGSTS
jgi:hypothetical protein